MAYNIKQVYVTLLTDACTLTDREGVGTLRFVGENIYKYVRADAVGAAVGELVYHSAENVVTKIPASTTALPAKKLQSFGVCLVAMTASYYGWIQIQGVVDTRKMAVLANKTGTRSYPVIGATLGRLNVVTTNQASLANILILETVSTVENTVVSCRVSFFH